jgi:predicted amidohydrolase YtcJ
MPSSVSSKDPGNSTAYINGHVYTINPQHPWASAFIISPNGIFTAVGTDEAILKQAHSTRLVTVGLKGQFVMPGIHDAHMHLLYSGLALTSDATLPMDHTHENIAQHIKDGSCACHYINTYQDWIMANMYFNGGFPDGVADRKYLDDLFPDTPVVVLGGGAHSRLLNTAALKRAGYDIENEPDVQGAKFFRRPDGSLTGEIAEHAMNKVALSIPFPGLAHIKRVLKYAIRMAHKAGVTSCQEASSNTLIMNALKELEEEGSLDMDIATHIVYAPETVAHERQESLLKLLDQADAYKSRHVNTRFVKIIMDGVPLPPLYTHCELDQDGKPNMDKILVQDFADAIAKYDERGMTVKIHCAGRGSTRLSLDAIEMAREKNPNGPRHEIAHSSSVHDGVWKWNTIYSD